MKKFILLLLVFFLSFSTFAQQGFESTTGPDALPSTNWTLSAGTAINGNWAVFDNAVGTGVRWGINNALPHQGVNAAYCTRENIGAGNTSEDFLATPSVTVPTNGQLKFWTRQFVATDFGTQYEIRVKLVTAGAQNDPTGYVAIQNWTESTLNATYDVYEEKVVDLPYPPGTNVYIAFVMIFTQPGATTSGDRWLVDDVQVIQACLAPTALTATAITPTSATLGWTNPNGTGTTFEIIHGLNGMPAPTATSIPTGTSTTNSFPQTGLSGLTDYCFYVRANCGSSNFSTWAGPFCYTTLISPPICGGNFVDFGGPTADYPNNENRTWTICPTNPGDLVTVTFTSFNTEATWDGLYVYDGSVAPGNLINSGNPADNVPGGLAGSFWGTTIPGPFTSTAANGCLVFVFRSDTSDQFAGWTANITCAPAPTCKKPTALVASNPTANSVSLSWTQLPNPNATTATAWQVLALPCGSTPPTATTPATGWANAATNTGFVMTLLNPATCYDFYVRASCSSTDVSDWSNVATATTLATCAKPTVQTATLITQTTALLGWTQPANPDSSFATAWQIQVLPCGSPAPTSSSTGWVNVPANPYFATLLTPGTCYEYYVRAICGPTDASYIAGPKLFNTLIPNDDCVGSIPVPVNQNTNCLQTVQGSLAFATASTQANSCDAANDDDDVWFHFIATATSHYVSLFGVNYTATPTRLKYAIYTGTCPTLTQFGTNCVTNAQQSNPILTGLTVGQTYYVRVYSAGTTPVTTNFELCIGTNVGNCSTALPLCAITPIVIPNNVGVSTLPNPISPYSTTSPTVGCLGSAPSPTFYYLQIPQDGNYNFFLEQNTSSAFNGTGIDVDFVAWGPYASNSAACAGISTTNAPPTGNSCSFSPAFTEDFTVNGALAGQIYVVMITNYNGQKGFVRITQTTGPLPTVCCPFGNFTYSSTFYCKNGANPSPMFVSNATAGTFSYTGAGFLDINPTTGLINLANSNVGTYQVHNIIPANGQCPADDDVWTITISAPPSAVNISYASSTYCRSDAASYPVTQTGTTGGNYTVAPAVGLGINLSTGTITPNASTVAGTYTITYNLTPNGGCLGATATTTVTITDTPTSGVLSGTQTVCLPGTTRFSTTGAGGVWSSSNTAIATVSSMGLVTGISAGTATITYNAIGTGGCSDSSSTRTVTFVQPVTAGPLSGNQLLCLPLPQTTQFTSAGTAGGTWTSLNPTIATVNATTGLVTAVVAGTATIRYTVLGTAPCANSVATRTVTISAASTAGTLSGTTGICVGNTTTFASTIGGGVWTSSNTAIATVDPVTGVVTGVSGTGTSTITYTITGTGNCGIATATRVVTVTLPPNAGVISGVQQICLPGTSQFTTTGAAGGTWSSTNTAVATVNSSGLVTGVGVGTADIKYFKFGTGGCSSATAIRTVTVSTSPTAGTLSGNQSICVAGTTTFASTNTTGTWSSINTAIATVNSTTGVVTGVSAGTTTINYLVPSSGSCASVTGTRTVTVTAPTNAGTLSGNQSICVAGTTTFTPTIAGGSWSSSDNTIVTVNATTGLITGIAAGTATITYTVSGTGGCGNATTTRTVTVIPPFAITVTGGCQGSPFILKVVPTTGVFVTGTVFSWSGPSGFSSNSQTPTAPQIGSYTVIVTDVNGCQSSGNILVNSISCVIQKGISPNNDMKNDTFDLTGYNVKTLNIYNRYGRKEYTLDNYTNEWGGQSDGGGELPDGAYYYQIDRTDGDSLTGWIYINRENK